MSLAKSRCPDSDEATEQAIGELAQGRLKDTDGQRLQDGCVNKEIRSTVPTIEGRGHCRIAMSSKC
jgi:hypothetical protein